MNADASDPHANQPVLTTGAALAEAAGAAILLHGRGANAADILGLAEVVGRADIAWLAPDAAGHVWYNSRFMAPGVREEPHYASAHRLVGRLVSEVVKAGVPAGKLAIMGFSQGACLALDFVARNPRRYGAAIALSGGLIGERIAPGDYTGSLDGTPVFLGVSDVDAHIPLKRVQESAAILKALGGAVTLSVYPGAPHTIVNDEVEKVRVFLDRMTAG
jgi:phospholipase/carboxylesterase